MKRIVILSVFTGLVVFLASCSTSTIAIDKAAISRVKTVAVMDFETGPHVQQVVATDCEDSFRGHFVNLGMTVVERKQLKSVIKEIERNQSGLVENSREIGRLAGADALLFGTVTQSREEVRWVTYYEYQKIKNTKETIKIEKRKQEKVFSFQLQIRLVSTASGDVIMTLKNTYPERNFDIGSSMTLAKHREYVVEQMGADLKKAINDALKK